MAVVKPPLVTVNPGQPVTAQGWNALVDGLSALYDAVLALGTGALEVSVTSQGQPVRGARVVAEPMSAPGNPILAVAPFGPHANYLVAGVSDGTWRVHVLAEGFNPEALQVNVPSASPVAIPLTPAGKFVPDLFGVPARQALSTLATEGFTIDHILDSNGQEVAHHSLPPSYENSPVLFQIPDAGTVIDPTTTRMRLVLAAVIQVEATVVMPSLIGLTYDEAVTALSRVGLKVGKTQVRNIVKPRPPDVGGPTPGGGAGPGPGGTPAGGGVIAGPTLPAGGGLIARPAPPAGDIRIAGPATPTGGTPTAGPAAGPAAGGGSTEDR